MRKKDKQAFFERNFNAEAFEAAKSVVQKAISNAKDFNELYQNLAGYERDTDFTMEESILYVEMELDRNHMETEADYVGVRFTILWEVEENKGFINAVQLYTSEKAVGTDEEIGYICWIHPIDHEILEWCI